MDAAGEVGGLEAKLAAADAGISAPPAAGPAAPGGDGSPAPADESQLWIEAAVRYGAMARAMLPANVQPHWTEDRLRAVGVELAACAKHYGWKWGGLLTHPLAKLAVVAFPLAWPLVEPYALPYIKGAMGGGELRAVQPIPDPAPDPGPGPDVAPPDMVRPVA